MAVTYTVFEYLYRDASNYKAWGELLLAGKAKPSHREKIMREMEGQLFFVPEKFGIPALQSQLYCYSNGPNEDDHEFHEFVCLRPATAEDIKNLEVWGTLDSLIDRLASTGSF